MESLDLSILRPAPGIEDSEFYNTRNFSYLTRVVRNVRGIYNIYGRIKEKKELGIDQEFAQLNPSFDAWINDLPGDLQITFPPDGSPPRLASHFIGNLHTYHFLSIILLHQLQLTCMESTGLNKDWKYHIIVCYTSAKRLCRLQESIVQSFGITGLLCMQRGIDFTIHCVLTCTTLYLVRIYFWNTFHPVLTITRSH
jgi:hypothetical protein